MQQYIEFFKSTPLLSLTWVGLFCALLLNVFKSSTSKAKPVDRQQATLLINKQDAKVVDVRSKEEFKKGHIVNAINLPLAEIKNNQIVGLEKFKANPILVVCNLGTTSTQAAQLLFKAGFNSVYSLKGGVEGWRENNLPVSTSKR